MKNLIIAFTALMALSNHVLAAAPADLQCRARDGSTLTWSERYGELSVVGPKGEEVADYDALILGESRYIETSPPKWITLIVDAGDETSVFAKIERTEAGIRILYEGRIYSCKQPKPLGA